MQDRQPADMPVDGAAVRRAIEQRNGGEVFDLGPRVFLASQDVDASLRWANGRPRQHIVAEGEAP